MTDRNVVEISSEEYNRLVDATVDDDEMTRLLDGGEQLDGGYRFEVSERQREALRSHGWTG